MNREEAGRLVGLSNTIHGKAKTPIYNLWAGMMTRCYNENFEKYHLYGGRGIRVCEEWHNFLRFYSDMGEKPRGMSLDRIDANGDYSKTNCRWASINEQNRNRRNVKWFTVDGECKTAQDWAKVSGCAPASITRRKLRGWTDHECVFGKSKR